MLTQEKQDIQIDFIWSLMEQVLDPEVPVLSVVDLGIIRSISLLDDAYQIRITPTYTGCPAMGIISLHIHETLQKHDIYHYKIITQLSPAWTTDWMSDSGKKKLKEYGIAPPMVQSRLDKMLFHTDAQPNCPRCDAPQTKLISDFGSTACKSLYQCELCKEPFDYFKCH